jgi:hypothetical protein
MALELVRDITAHLCEISLVNRGDIVTPRPTNGSADAAIRAHCGDRLGETHEIAQPGVGAKADDQVYMISQHGFLQDSDSCSSTGA